MNSNHTFFTSILKRLSALSDVPFELLTQQFWRDSPHFVPILQSLIDKRHSLGPHLSPETHKLGIRAACPEPSCGLADKKGIHNCYEEKGTIKFLCPHHGAYVVNLKSRDHVQRLGFNTPLRNLMRILICSQDTSRSWLMCTGSDYAGFYQEQLMWRLLETPAQAPLIIYAPQIVDWSGAKLSKSLYVQKGAYEYLRQAGLAYMLEVDTLLSKHGGIEALYDEVASWIAQPFRLFRSYSIEYMHAQLRARGMMFETKQSDLYHT
ncbi:hypothetical protein BWQ96_05123 [Gracilariopsis chorda]|uniref:Uncharacterized protein n=1 Tax=Gracilariopsis chorda TaxID=448386 RepID=A0A2V3ISK4_9FLOR|nr:hypothetical protein BWQ96_05123 [Gracilariopsis chorda]|eukprot:PXF45084.1 hypothetical protein BWQ96_05123 [Gracilariopsis chorda]